MRATTEHLFAGAEARAPSRIGPNALIQTAQALNDDIGAAASRRLFASAGLVEHYDVPPETMVDEREPIALFATISRELGRTTAARVFADAGDRTGAYILKNRIPKPARMVLSALPAPVAARLLTQAISKHAWTFAGSGVFHAGCQGWRRTKVTLEIAENPLATPGCPWHGAVFTHLFGHLVSPELRLTHATCCARGEGTCRTVLELG